MNSVNKKKRKINSTDFELYQDTNNTTKSIFTLINNITLFNKEFTFIKKELKSIKNNINDIKLEIKNIKLKDEDEDNLINKINKIKEIKEINKKDEVIIDKINKNIGNLDLQMLYIS